jgi:hypothetical protein
MIANEMETAVLTDEFIKFYVRLRTVLDAVEANAIRYCLENEDVYERVKRAEEMEQLLLPVIERIPEFTGEQSVIGKCGPGYYNCGGICVPYKCPFGGGDK